MHETHRKETLSLLVTRILHCCYLSLMSASTAFGENIFILTRKFGNYEKKQRFLSISLFCMIPFHFIRACRIKVYFLYRLLVVVFHHTQHFIFLENSSSIFHIIILVRLMFACRSQVNEACQEAVPKTTKKLKRKKSKDLKHKQKQSNVSETSEFQIKEEKMELSETNGLQQKQLFQDSYNNYIESMADYDKHRYNNLMKTLIKDEPVEQDDVEMHLNNHIIAVVSDNNITDDIESTEECDTVTSVAHDTNRKVKEQRNKKERTIANKDYTRIYNCGKCSFFGVHKEYTEHKNVCKYINKKIYECKKCYTCFRSTYDFVSHYVREGWAPLQCFDCDELLDNRITYENHVFSHMFSIKCYTRGKVTFKCNLCNHILGRPDYHKHWLTHIDLGNVKCVTLKQIIKVIKERRSKRHMTIPEKLTDDEIKSICNMLATTKKDLLKGKRKSCCYCNKAFSRVENAKVHMIEHLLTNAYLMKQHFKALICQFCLEPLQTSDSFKLHMTTHAYLKRHHCELCSKTFSDSSNYSKHKKIHNLLVLICDLCSKKFASKKMLIQHFAKVSNFVVRSNIRKYSIRQISNI